MRRFIVAAVVTLATACASHTTPTTNPVPAPGQPPPPPPPPPPPAAGRQTGLRFGPSALRYVMHQKVDIEQDVPQGHQQTTYGFSTYFRVTIVGPADSIGYPMTVTIDSITSDSGTTVPTNVDISTAKGLTFTGKLTPLGEFVKSVPSDTLIAQSTAAIVGGFRSFFPRIPAAGVTPGAAWTDTLATNEGGSGTTVRTILQSRAPVWEDRNGVRCLRIEATGTFTMQGSAQQGGQHIDISGSGVRSGVDYLAADGRYMGGQSSDTTNMTLSLRMESVTVPRKQVAQTTVMVLP